MGFYSFYRIFKDIIKSIFGNKAWRYTLIIALIVFVFTIFSTKSQAADLRPWNVYTNTTEFNWLRLTGINYVDSSFNLSNNNFEIKANEVYYLYNPNSNNGTLRFYCYVSNDNNMILQLLEHTPQYSYLNLETNYVYNGGYVDIPYNKPFTPQFGCQISISSSSSYELYMLDDQYSNIEAYNELSAIADYLYGTPTPGTGTIQRANLSLHAATTNSSFYYTGNSDNIFYVEIEPSRVNKINFHVDVPNYPNSVVSVGYCDSVPAENVNTTYYTHFSGSASYDFEYSFSGHKYVYVRAYGSSSSVSITSYSVANVGLEGMNDNATHQGEATRQTITDSSISQNSSDYTLPTDSTNDITNDGFTSIFDRIRSTFTTGSSTPAVINIPFTNKSFTISKASVFGSANLGIVQTIIEAFWWFVVSVFIVKDIFKKIEKIKTGNIEFTETTNIKEDIL